MKTTTAIATAFVLLAPSAYALNDNSAAVSGSNNDVNQITGTGNVLSTGSGAFGSSANVTNNNTANGGNATANGGAVIGSGNSSATGGRGGDGGTGLGVGIGGNQSQSATTGNQNATTGNQSVNVAAAKRNAPALISSGLVAGSDTCLGSSSAGISTPFGAINGGGTQTDKDCVRIKMSRELTSRGFNGAAVAMLCHNDEVRQAMATAGTPCASDAVVAESDNWEPTVSTSSVKPDNGSRNR